MFAADGRNEHGAWKALRCLQVSHVPDERRQRMAERSRVARIATHRHVTASGSRGRVLSAGVVL